MRMLMTVYLESTWSESSHYCKYHWTRITLDTWTLLVRQKRRFTPLGSIYGAQMALRVCNASGESDLRLEFVKCWNCVSGAGQIEFEVLLSLWFCLCYDVAFLGFGYLTHRQMTFSWHIDPGKGQDERKGEHRLFLLPETESWNLIFTPFGFIWGHSNFFLFHLSFAPRCDPSICWRRHFG